MLLNVEVTCLAKCYSRLYLLKQLKCMGMDTNGLKTYYTANVKPVICYAGPAWFNFLTEGDKQLLEKTQRYATRIMLPHIELYNERLDILSIPRIDDSLAAISTEHFIKISNDNNHPLHNRIKFNTQRISARKAKVDKFRPSICRTVKRQKSFFESNMRFFN